MNKKIPSEGIPGFNWAETREMPRIKRNTERYKNMDITEAFAMHYNLPQLKKTAINIAPPPEFHIGEYVNLTIQKVDKKQIIFDQTNFKEEIQCTVNLAQYPRFKNLTKPVEISCRVVSKTDSKVLVDPLYWFYDQFVTTYVKNLDYQYNIKERFQPFVARNLRLVRGGFMGNLRMDGASDFFGKDIFLEVFIPGSQIIVNVEKDFERWVGKDVPIYIVNHMEKPGSDIMVLVGSSKEYYKLNAQIELIDVFKGYCENNDAWRELKKQTFDGTVTGVVHTSNKCGIFVEVGQQTGMIECTPEEILGYKAGQSVKVHYKGFNELLKYNSMADQMQHVDPYIIEDDILKKFNLKVTFEFA